MDWNANRKSEIAYGTDCTSDLASVTAIERVDEVRESRVPFTSDEELMLEEVMETHDSKSDSTTVAMAIASPSYSVPPTTDFADADAPPPLPTTQPPSSSPLVHDTSQELSILVEDDSHSTGDIVSPPSPYATSEPELNERGSSSCPSTEQQLKSCNEDLAGEDPTDIYSGLSEEDRLLIQRVLSTNKEDQTSELEETMADKPVAAENYNEPEEKYSELSESDRKLIKNTLTSLDKGQANSATVPQLQSHLYADKDEGGTGKEDVITKEMKVQELSQNQNKDNNEDAERLSSGAEKEDLISAEMKVQELYQHENEVTDERIDADVLVDVSVGAALSDEHAVTPDQLVSTTSSPTDDLKTSESTDGNPVNSPHESYEEPTIGLGLVSLEIYDTTVSKDEEADSANHSSSTATVSPENTTDEKNCTPVGADNQNYSEPIVVVSMQASVNEATEIEETETAGSKLPDDVFHNSSDNVPSDAAQTDTLSKSRRLIVSDEAVSGILRDYYTADADAVEEKKPDKSPPAKPLIAQALLPKASRRSFGASDRSTTVAAAAAPHHSSFSSSKLGYGQVKIPRAIALSGEPDCQESEDGQGLKPVMERYGDDVTVSRDSVSEKVRESSVGTDKSTSGDAEIDDGRQVPTVAESRAFFKSREAATKCSSEMISTTAADDSSRIGSSRSVHSDVSKTSLPPWFKAQTETPKVTDSQTSVESTGNKGGGDGTVPTSRVSLSTRWAPRPFPFTTPAAKAAPTFVTFDPTIPTSKTLETSESEVRTSHSVKMTSLPSTSAGNSSFSGVPKTGSETASEPKPKLSSAIPTTTKTVEAAGSVEGSSCADEDEWTTKSSDIEIDAVGTAELPDTGVTAHDRHPPMSATAMATELRKKVPMRMSSISGQRTWLKQVKDLSSVGVGRSTSTSEADVQPKSEQAVLSDGCMSCPPQTVAKSWTQFDYRKTVLPARTETASSTVDVQDSAAPSSEVAKEVEHIDVASSMAFFQAAEMADRQASSQPADRTVRKKPAQSSSVKTVTDAKDDVELVLTSSSESSQSTHSAPYVTSLGKQSLYCRESFDDDMRLVLLPLYMLL